jgi:osmotically-inducible protein OsmY
MNSATTVVHSHATETPLHRDASRTRLHVRRTQPLGRTTSPVNSLDWRSAINNEVEVCLQSHLNTAVHTVSYQYEEGVLTLNGRLSSFYQKQLAQESVRNLDGIRRVVNRIEVSHSKS